MVLIVATAMAKSLKLENFGTEVEYTDRKEIHGIDLKIDK